MSQGLDEPVLAQGQCAEGQEPSNEAGEREPPQTPRATQAHSTVADAHAVTSITDSGGIAVEEEEDEHEEEDQGKRQAQVASPMTPSAVLGSENRPSRRRRSSVVVYKEPSLRAYLKSEDTFFC